MSVQMELHKIIISEMQDKQLIWLKEVDGERKFTIVIGSPEAMAIDRRVDSRPSDAIALGIATMVPIYVAEHVLEEVAD